MIHDRVKGSPGNNIKFRATTLLRLTSKKWFTESSVFISCIVHVIVATALKWLIFTNTLHVHSWILLAESLQAASEVNVVDNDADKSD